MIDEKDLQQTKELMDAQKSEILQQAQKLMRAQKDKVLHQAAQNTQVIIENTIGKQLQLLLEDQKLIVETLTPLFRVDAPES